METEKLEIERKSFFIFSGVMILLMCLSIFLIQKSDTDLAEARIKDKQEDAFKEATALAKQDKIFTTVASSEKKVTTLTAEVKGYRNDVVTNTKTHEKSLNNFNNLKSQNETVYIPNATIDQQTDYLSNYKYEAIGAD